MTEAKSDEEAAKSWPFQEARALAAHVREVPADTPIIFETGYGPSGLPHIGTFGEVARTTMVRRAFEALTGRPTRLIAFSDDMDGMRKVPDNVPQQDMMAAHLQKPLTQVPDPFGTHDSFAHHNNARLRGFLDSFGFDYEFVSATEAYRTGRLDAVLRRSLERFDDIMEIVLPTLGPERRRTYSPFLPISPTTGRVLQTPTLERDLATGAIAFEDEDGVVKTAPVTGGAVKMQWKVDWATRWAALGVHYEMAGEDLTESVKLSSRIVRVLGGKPPAGFLYQLFLDENGEKISKSKGNGLTIEEWLRYGPEEALSLFMFQRPKAAKKLHFDVIPKSTDDYLNHVRSVRDADGAARLDNPAWHIHSGAPPTEDRSPISFAVLLNLVSAADADDPAALWGFIGRYAPDASPQTHPFLDRLVAKAVAYYRDHVKASKRRRAPTAQERAAMTDLLARLDALSANERDPETIQTEVFAAGKAHDFDPLRAWFQGLYETLLGQSSGPRFGSFAAVYGLEETKALLRDALARESA